MDEYSKYQTRDEPPKDNDDWVAWCIWAGATLVVIYANLTAPPWIG